MPPFGLMKGEKAALGIFVLSGLIALALFPLELFDTIAVGKEGARIAETYLWRAGKMFLVLQGALVILTPLGALLRSFIIVAAGILSGLVFITPIGALTFLPAVGMLLLTRHRLQAFREFTPRWKGPGPPPPGNWR